MFSKRRKNSPSAARVTTRLLLSFLAIGVSASDRDTQAVLAVDFPPIPPLQPEPPTSARHVFTLRHVFHHGTHRDPKLHVKQDVSSHDATVWLAAEDGYGVQQLPPLRARSNAMRIERLVDRRPTVVDPMVALAREKGFVSVLGVDAWTLDDIPGPDVTDKETIISLAYMASNAYQETSESPDWEEVGRPFNKSLDFGWDQDGLRGHVWADQTNSTVVIGLKGTSSAVFDGDGTTTNDKENDNLFFSCCCAQQGPWTWRKVCDCATGTYSCNNTCVVQALKEEHRYYQAARELYANVTELYPTSNVWLTGHSLGGAVSSLLGLTYGLPTVTFEAVPEALAASRLGLPIPPGADPSAPQTREYTGAFHFGHTADPVYIGTCNGFTATCTFAGYAMESSCHTGRECAYDTVGDKGWRVGIGTHKIRVVIHDVLMKYDEVPECKFTPECRDCANWKMYESNGSETTTTSAYSSSTATRTRTETCKTPGWWGCLDETTTTTATTPCTTTTTTTTTTATCMTPGWFGCKDMTTTTTSTTTATSTIYTTPLTTSMPVETSTSTCSTPGFFWGCWDKPTTMTCSTSSATATATAPTSTITPPPTLPVPAPPAEPTTTAARKEKCQHRGWFGFCKDGTDGAARRENLNDEI